MADCPYSYFSESSSRAKDWITKCWRDHRLPLQNYQIRGIIQIPNKITLQDECSDRFNDSLKLSFILTIENLVPEHNMLFKSLKDSSDLSVCDICPSPGLACYQCHILNLRRLTFIEVLFVNKFLPLPLHSREITLWYCSNNSSLFSPYKHHLAFFPSNQL